MGKEEVQPWYPGRHMTWDHSHSNALATCHLASPSHPSLQKIQQRDIILPRMSYCFWETPPRSYYLGKWEFSHKESRSLTSLFFGNNSVLLIAMPPNECEARNKYVFWCQQLLVPGRLHFPRLFSCHMWHLMCYFYCAPGSVKWCEQ